MWAVVMICMALWLELYSFNADATAPSYEGAPMPQAFLDRLASNPRAFQFNKALTNVTERAMVARQLESQPQLSGLAAGSPLALSLSSSLGGTSNSAPSNRVQGRQIIPVILLNFPESPAPTFTPEDLRKELFDGPWQTGTLRQYYSDVSNNALTVDGKISPWVTLPRPQSYYAGSDYRGPDGKMTHCYGVCPKESKMAELIRDALEKNRTFDWGAADNDGPDGVPNSGDDNGLVDFVAFIHAGRGGECGEGNGSNPNIWSHRGSFSLNLGLPPIETNSKRAGGGRIKIEDYVVLPALGCDGSTMIPIGVIAHEFGHAYGLPDLYDVKGRTNGLGNWDLMATGAWGGDNNSPDTPTHMSAWSKQLLGWIEVKDMNGQEELTLSSIETSHTAYRINVSRKMYYLLSVREKIGFDRKLPTSGLEVLLVNEDVTAAGLRSNTVNADPQNMGVKLIEADGLNRLSNDTKFRGDAANLFPGQMLKRAFDSTTNPRAIGQLAVCHIPDPTDPMKVIATTVATSCASVQLAQARDVLLAAPASPSDNEQSATASASPPLVPGTSVVVTGRLENVGTNYFKPDTRRIILRNEEGEEVNVSTSVPLEATPGTGRPPVGILSDFLDRNVEIRGVVEKGATEGDRPVVRATEMRVIQ
ncbi:M6 family metalloprotease domain-containing protein [Paraburkholderia graminis]|uniref:M6 family metalloprotease domain-containing protein n=1 Tax=Paraburkholderia graminis TaxID=60548 RepID=UPI0027909EE8|nr:M6 family metalloprotease domain-containing protein [Paraburkholderia graminis]MDQ0627135.1 M6 family metalloprotease-like protein [Paraburkholderia graminis]